MIFKDLVVVKIKLTHDYQAHIAEAIVCNALEAQHIQCDVVHAYYICGHTFASGLVCEQEKTHDGPCW